MKSGIESFSQRLQRLEDIEAIKFLKARYCYACDGGWSAEKPGHDWDEVQHMFTEDGAWDAKPVSFRAEGHDALRQLYAEFRQIPFVVHNVMNPRIRIDGDRATAKWNLIELVTVGAPADPTAAWSFVFYDDICVRTPTGWKFKEVKVSFAAFTRFDVGWAKERMMQLP